MKKRFLAKALSVLVCATMAVGMGALASAPVLATEGEVVVEAADETTEEAATEEISDDIEEPSEDGETKVHGELESLNITSESVVLDGDTTVKGDVIISGNNSLKLDKNKLNVGGKIIVKDSSVLNVTNSQLTVAGNIELADGENTIKAIIRSNENTVINVGGDFICNTSENIMAEFSSSAGGVLDLKGNYTDKRGIEFHGTLNMTGEDEQTITLTNTSKIKYLKASNKKVKASILRVELLDSDVTITPVDKDVIISDSMDLQKNTLTIDGNLIVSGSSNIKANSSTINVTGNLTYEYEDNKVAANLRADIATIVNVDGDFVWNSTGYLMGQFYNEEYGVINLKGNYTEKNGSQLNGTLNMVGDKEQVITMPKTSYINVLKGTNQNVKAEILNARSFASDMIITGTEKGTTITKDCKLNNHTVTFKGDLYVSQSACLNVEGSKLNVNGSLIYEYEGSPVAAKLDANVETIIIVDKDFIWNSTNKTQMAQYSHQREGVMRIKGNYENKTSDGRFNGTMEMLTPGSTISSKANISKLILNGPKSAYKFTTDKCWDELVCELSNTEIAVGQKYPIKELYKDVQNIKKYKVTSSDGGKGKVKKGMLTASKPGTLLITPVDASGNEVASGVTIIVKKPAFTVKKINAVVGDTITADTIIKDIPEGNKVEWSSSKTAVATVDAATGEIKVLKKGKTTIKVKITNSENYSKTYKITLKAKNA